MGSRSTSRFSPSSYTIEEADETHRSGWHCLDRAWSGGARLPRADPTRNLLTTAWSRRALRAARSRRLRGHVAAARGSSGDVSRTDIEHARCVLRVQSTTSEVDALVKACGLQPTVIQRNERE